MNTQTKIIIVILFLLIFISGIFLLNKKTQNFPNDENVREIVINARSFEFEPSTIKIKEGEKVRIKINSLDTKHTIFIPELGIKIDTEKEFAVNKKGNFSFSCSTYCGEGHGMMRGILIVE